jgi:hypothetical protein
MDEQGDWLADIMRRDFIKVYSGMPAEAVNAMSSEKVSELAGVMCDFYRAALEAEYTPEERRKMRIRERHEAAKKTAHLRARGKNGSGTGRTTLKAKGSLRRKGRKDGAHGE